MFNYDDECLKAFMDNQEKLIGRKEFTTKEEADEFLADVMAVKLDTIEEVREYLIDAGMDAYGLSDEDADAYGTDGTYKINADGSITLTTGTHSVAFSFFFLSFPVSQT